MTLSTTTSYTVDVVLHPETRVYFKSFPPTDVKIVSSQSVCIFPSVISAWVFTVTDILLSEEISEVCEKLISCLWLYESSNQSALTRVALIIENIVTGIKTARVTRIIILLDFLFLNAAATASRILFSIWIFVFRRSLLIASMQ